MTRILKKTKTTQEQKKEEPKPSKTINMEKIVVLNIIVLMIIVLFVFSKNQIGYAVIYQGNIIGYASEKSIIENTINNDILSTDDESIAFVALDNVEYNKQLVSIDDINNENIIALLKQSAKNIYNVYEISGVEGTESIFVNSKSEAEELVNEYKEKYAELEPDLKISTLYLEEKVSDETIQEAKNKINEELDQKLEEKKEIEKRTVNGIYLACLPVEGGTISSRYGSIESVRNHAHGGLDVAAREGTTIKAAASGTVKFAGVNGGYGNLVIIDHGNGVETYYGHCSALYVNEGQYVEAGEKIAAVGSTGSATGSHLHFEVRINGVTTNPQKYLY